MPRRLPLLLSLSLPAACGCAPTAITAPGADAVPTLPPAEFPGAAKLLAGFDDRAGDASWQTGDSVLFGLRLRRGTVVRRWLLRLEVVLGQEIVAQVNAADPVDVTLWGEKTWDYSVSHDGVRHELQAKSLLLPVAACVADEHGTQLGSSIVQLPAQLLGGGLLRAVDCSGALMAKPPRPGEPFREENVRPMVEGAIALMALLSVVQGDEVLADYFWQVVEKPSVWSVATNLGVSASLSVPFERAAPAASLPAHLPAVARALVVPLAIDVNGSRALLADVLAADAQRPYALAGGMRGAVARHPSAAGVQFEVQLLAARLGKPQKARVTLDRDAKR